MTLVSDQPRHSLLEGTRSLLWAGVSHFFPERIHLLIDGYSTGKSPEFHDLEPFPEEKWSFPREVVYLCKILLRDPPSPFDAQVQGATRVGYISTLDHHTLDQDLVFRKVLPSRVAFTVAALNLENRWSH